MNYFLITKSQSDEREVYVYGQLAELFDEYTRQRIIHGSVVKAYQGQELKLELTARPVGSAQPSSVANDSALPMPSARVASKSKARVRRKVASPNKGKKRSDAEMRCRAVLGNRKRCTKRSMGPRFQYLCADHQAPATKTKSKKLKGAK